MIKRLSSNASTVIVFLAAFGYLAYLNSVNPEKAGDQLLPVLGAAGAVARVLYQVDEAKAKSDAAAAQSQNNGDKLITLDAKVDGNTTLTEQAVETVETTHKIVNNELSKWKQSVIDQSEKDRLLWEERSKSLIADALAEGQRLGRAEMETSHQGTVTEAARVASVAAETATEAARVVVDAAASAAALLKTAEPPAAGTVVVEVDALPATIHVTTAEEGTP